MHRHRLQSRSFALAVLATAALVPIAARAQQTNEPASTPSNAQGTAQPGAQSVQPTAGAFRGTIVCARVPNPYGVLRAPFDLTVSGAQVSYARPIFNWNSTRVLGSEMGSGTLEPDGKLHVTSRGAFGGMTYRSDYSGTLAATGGTLTGTQSWQGGRAGGGNRTCSIAVVPAPQPQG